MNCYQLIDRLLLNQKREREREMEPNNGANNNKERNGLDIGEFGSRD